MRHRFLSHSKASKLRHRDKRTGDPGRSWGGELLPSVWSLAEAFSVRFPLQREGETERQRKRDRETEIWREAHRERREQERQKMTDRDRDREIEVEIER